MRPSSGMAEFCLIAMVTLACFVCLAAAEGQVRGQNADLLTRQISDLRKQIKNEEEAHASVERLATSWIVLADAYQGELDEQSAEDAFAHAIRLLRGSGAKDLYASALDGIATVYYASGHTDTAERFLRQALEVAHTPGGSKIETSIRKDLAVTLIAEQRYAEAEKQASEALQRLEAQSNPDTGDMIIVHLTRSRALCEMRRYEEALQEVDRAGALADSKVADSVADSIDPISIAAVRSMVQIRSGAVDQGERTMQHALQLVADTPDLPASARIRLRVHLLEGYSESLGSARRKQERKKVEEELARAKAQKSGCNGCTVSVAALGLLP